MDVGLFDFSLPDELIALEPAEPRESAKLLVVTSDGSSEHSTIGELGTFLRPGDALVFNDTRVIPAQLQAVRERSQGRAHVSFTLHKRIAPDRWLAFARGSKKLAVGDRLEFADVGGEVCAKLDDGSIEVRFDLQGRDMLDVLDRVGSVPIPPYISSKRAISGSDRANYQTVYADRPGAVAAPTAGLHFTDQLLRDLASAGIEQYFVTLHVGAGTFLPVKVDDTDDHRMHSEWGEVSAEIAEQLNAVRARGNRTVAVGTTSLRLLESAVRSGRIEAWSGDTDIFLVPGSRFEATDALVTNFHLPRSTLFMLVSAFAGLDRMKDAYATAIAERYRFYSYGDASLLFANPETGAEPRP